MNVITRRVIVFPGGFCKKVPEDPLTPAPLLELPPGEPLHEVILAEKEELTEDEYLSKAMVWVKLLRYRK